MKQLGQISLLAAAYLVGLAYLMFDDTVASISNWFVFVQRPMTDAWNVKYLTDQEIRPLLVACFAVWVCESYSVPFLVRLAALEYFVYCLLDMAVYPFWFKTAYYWPVYLAVGLVSGIVYYKKKRL